MLPANRSTSVAGVIGPNQIITTTGNTPNPSATTWIGMLNRRTFPSRRPTAQRSVATGRAVGTVRPRRRRSGPPGSRPTRLNTLPTRREPAPPSGSRCKTAPPIGSPRVRRRTAQPAPLVAAFRHVVPLRDAQLHHHEPLAPRRVETRPVNQPIAEPLPAVHRPHVHAPIAPPCG